MAATAARPEVSDKPLLRVLSGMPQHPPPVWLMRQAGRHLPEYRLLRARASGFLDLCYRPELAVEATLQPVRRYGVDAAILFSDILVIPDALGVPLTFVDGEGPKLTPLDPARDLDRMATVTEEQVEAHLQPVFETVARTRAALPKGVALIGFAGAPWTVATYMVEGGTSRDFAATRALAYGNPAAFSRLIALIVRATATYLSAQVQAGAEALQLFDSWAGVLGEEQFDRWVIAPTRELVGRVRRQHPDIPIIGFARGAGLHTPRYAAESGVDALGLDAMMPTAWARDHLQPTHPVQGNLDPLLLAQGGAAMARATRHILDDLRGGPFIFNLGHGVLKDTDPAHVTELLRLVRATPAETQTQTQTETETEIKTHTQTETTRP